MDDRTTLGAPRTGIDPAPDPFPVPPPPAPNPAPSRWRWRVRVPAAVTPQQAGLLIAFAACCALVLGGLAGLWVTMRDLWITPERAALQSVAIMLVVAAGGYGAARLWPPGPGKSG